MLLCSNFCGAFKAVVLTMLDNWIVALSDSRPVIGQKVTLEMRLVFIVCGTADDFPLKHKSRPLESSD